MSPPGGGPWRRGGAPRAPMAALIRLWPLWLWLAAAPAAAELQAQLGKARLAAGEPVTLTLTSDAPLPAAPDLSALAADFQVIDRRQAQTVSTVNGHRRERHALILTLLPRRSGQLAVPPLTIGAARTSALSLTVAAATSADARLLPAPAEAAPSAADAPPQPITLDADITPGAGVVGEEFLLTLRVRSPAGPPQGHLPNPQAADAELLPLGTSRSTAADGAHILSARFSLFPARAGELAITGLGFDAWQPAGGAPVRHRVEPLTVTVQPIPAGEDAETWLPARALTLTEGGPTEVRIAPGQGLERMLMLRAEGLPAERLPAIPIGIPFQLRVQSDPPRLWNEHTPTGIVGYRTERVLISAPEPGGYVLPGPTIAWWDTQERRSRTAQLPDWTLTVAPLASADRRPAARWSRDPPGATGAAQAPAAAEETADSPARTGAGDDGSAPGWRALAALAVGLSLIGGLVGGLVGAVLWRLRRRARRRREYQAAARPQPAAEHAMAPAAASDLDGLVAAVADAYARSAAVEARSALLAWGAAMWPRRPPGNLAQMMLRLEPPLSDDLKLLDKTFYGPDDGAWAKRPVAAGLAALRNAGATASAADAAAPGQTTTA